MGGPNFHEIPINASIAQVHNNQRDGFHRQAINRGRVNYEPNSLGGGCPFQAGLQGFTKTLAREAAIRFGQVGWPALGVAYGILGFLLIYAAVTYDPKKATGMDTALKTLAGQAYGTLLLLMVAAGLACFGAYCLFDARYRRG